MVMSFRQVTLPKEDVSQIKLDAAQRFSEAEKDIVAWIKSNVDRWGRLTLSNEWVSEIQSQEAKQDSDAPKISPFLQSVLDRYTKF